MQKIERLRLLSFGIFDSGETILGALVFSTFFPLYITKHIDTKLYSTLYGLSFLFSFATAVYLGKMADQKAIRKHLFVAFTLLTTLFGTFVYLFHGHILLALVFYLAMAVLHQQSIVFYNSLLMSFPKRGIASGLGVAMGYVGSALSLLFLARYLSVPFAFLLPSILFFILSLPSILTLENPKEKSHVSLTSVLSEKRFLLFIISLLSLTEVANTMIAMMSVYLRNVYGFEDREVYKVIGLSALGGVAGGIVWGKLVDRWGSKRTFPVGFFLWTSFLIALYFVPKSLVLSVGLLAGFSLSHLWTTSRVFLIENFSKTETAVRMSFLSLTERIASSFGLLLWSLLLYLTDDNYRLSALLMVFVPLLGFVLFLYSTLREK